MKRPAILLRSIGTGDAETSFVKKQVHQMERIINQLKENLVEKEQTNLGLLAENKSLVELIVLEPDEEVFR